MEKAKFLEIIQNPQHITAEHATLLEKIIQASPYCSIAHILLAKYFYENKSLLASQYIKKAHIYNANKRIFKKILAGEISFTASSEETHDFSSQETSYQAIEFEKTEEQKEPEIFEIEELPVATVEPSIAKDYTQEVIPEISKPSYTSIDILKEIEEENKKITIEFEKTEEQKRQEALINQFLSTKADNTTRKIKRDAAVQKEEEITTPSENISKLSFIEEKKEIPFTLDSDNIFKNNTQNLREDFNKEATAQNLFNEGKIAEGIEIYKTLIQKSPERKSYFTTQIEILGGQEAIDLLNDSASYQVSNIETPIIEEATENLNFLENLTSSETSLEEKPTEEIATAPIEQDNTVTEINAMNLYMDGKTDEAVAVYKKLMLKYPEKSDYFASQIEVLQS